MEFVEWPLPAADHDNEKQAKLKVFRERRKAKEQSG